MWKKTSFDGDFMPAPRMSNMDYVRARLGHTNKRVTFEGRFVQLRHPTRQIFSMYTGIGDQDGNRWVLSMAASRTGADSGLYTWRYRELRCDVTQSVNYRRNTIRRSLPRRCIDRPRSLQFHAGSSIATRPRTDTFFVDDLHSGRGVDGLWGHGELDTIDGSAGNDTIGGGAGDDRITGGTGIDTAHFDASAVAVTVDLTTG